MLVVVPVAMVCNNTFCTDCRWMTVGFKQAATLCWQHALMNASPLFKVHCNKAPCYLVVSENIWAFHLLDVIQSFWLKSNYTKKKVQKDGNIFISYCFLKLPFSAQYDNLRSASMWSSQAFSSRKCTVCHSQPILTEERSLKRVKGFGWGKA